MAKKITITLSDRAERYLAELKYSLEFDCKVANQSQCVSHALEELAAFEDITADQITNYIQENHPRQAKEFQKDYLKPLLKK